MRKATNLTEIDSAVQFNIPVGPDHEFFTDFSHVRGDFEEKVVYKNINVNPQTFTFNLNANLANKTLLFLAGMRGSGKTSELEKYAKNLENPDCFFVVTCNIDQELDMNDLEYMDILILQLEKLVEKANQYGIQLNESVVASMQEWFSQAIEEINSTIKDEAAIETGVKGDIGLPIILTIFSRLRAGITGTNERATKIRSTFKNRFNDFALKFNTFIEEVNVALRKNGIAQEILFIVDGLEKTYSSEVRKKIILDEANRMQHIKVNAIFTLPIELIPSSQKIKMHSKVVSFPFVKVCDRHGKLIGTAIDKFEEFVYRRISAELFDSPETVRKAIQFGGGSPRELLRLLDYANIYADDEKGIIDLVAMDKAIRKLANETAQYLTEEELDKLKELKEKNEQEGQMAFDPIMMGLLEKLIVMEYNDGTYKRVNPLVEVSELYQQYVG